MNALTQGRKVRVLHLVASGFVGGPEKQILSHAAGAASPDMEIWVGSFREAGARPAILTRAEKLGLPILEFTSGKFDPRAALELARGLREKGITILCTHGYRANIVGWVASRLRGCPQVAFVRGWTAETWRVRLYERLDRFVLARADWVACVSRPQAERLSTKRRKRRPPVVIPNATLFSLETVAFPVDRRPVRNALGLPERAFLVGAFGRLSVEKGHRYLLDAVSELVSRIPNLRVLVLGEGRERRNLEEQVIRLGVQDRVSFTGFVTPVKPWIQACDVLVNPSLTEGMPNVILEAMALGTPVVATAVGGVPDMMQDQASGLLVPPGDSSALAVAVVDLYMSPPKALRLAQNARTQAYEYSPDNQQQRLLDLYSMVLSDSVRGHGKVTSPEYSLTSQQTPEIFRGSQTASNTAGNADHRSASASISKAETPGARGRTKGASLPLISIVIPVRNEEAHLGELFEDLLKQDYPPDRFEILVADGNSTDRTKEIVEEYSRRSRPRIQWLPNPRQLSSAGRNIGARASRGELVLFIDGHCRIPNATLLRDTVEIFETTGADCLCRPQPLDVDGNTWFQDVVANARASFLGHGRDSTIYAKDFEGFVNPTSSGAVYRRYVFERVGMFDEHFDACEDVDFNYRVHRAGLRSYLSSRTAIWYRPRTSLLGLCRQLVRYGRGRLRFMRKHPEAMSISQLVPAAFVAWLVLGAPLSLFSTFFAKVYVVTLGLYAGLALFFSAWSGVRYGWRHFLVAPAVYFAIHASLGLGFWVELWHSPTTGARTAQNYQATTQVLASEIPDPPKVRSK